MQGKNCPINFCDKCLLTRRIFLCGENAEEVGQLGDWICPKCLGFCNCRFRVKMRSFIHEKNERYLEERKDAKIKFAAAKEKEKCSHEKLQNEMTKVVLSNVSLDENVNDLTTIKNEVIKSKAAQLKRHHSKRTHGSMLHTCRCSKVEGNFQFFKQCRQKKENFVAICSNIKKGKNCSIKFCGKCLLTRYGENAEEVGQLGDWICPKCRGFCNCSFCRKKQGEQPTGPLYRSAKESGFKSVAEMLATKKASEALVELNKVNDVAVLSPDETTVKKELEGHMSNVVKLERQVIEDEIPLPPGVELTQILEIDLTHKDVGNAFQFLEFCKVFGRALDLTDGEAIAILKGLGHQQCLDGRNNNLVIHFLMKLLMLILNDSRIESLTKFLEGLIRDSSHILHDFPLDWLQKGLYGYHELHLSKKFKLLIFLCDEVLITEKMRSFIHERNERFLKERKEAKIKYVEAKEKEKSLKQKLKNETTKVVPSNMSHSQRDENDLSIIKNEVIKSKEDMLNLNDAIVKDIKIQDGASSDENWFVYGPEKKNEVDNYISYRTKKIKSSKVSHKLGH